MAQRPADKLLGCSIRETSTLQGGVQLVGSWLIRGRVAQQAQVDAANGSHQPAVGQDEAFVGDDSPRAVLAHDS